MYLTKGSTVNSSYKGKYSKCVSLRILLREVQLIHLTKGRTSNMGSTVNVSY